MAKESIQHMLCTRALMGITDTHTITAYKKDCKNLRRIADKMVSEHHPNLQIERTKYSKNMRIVSKMQVIDPQRYTDICLRHVRH